MKNEVVWIKNLLLGRFRVETVFGFMPNYLKNSFIFRRHGVNYNQTESIDDYAKDGGPEVV